MGVHVVVRTLNLEISRCHLTDYAKELYKSPCRTIFPHSPTESNRCFLALPLSLLNLSIKPCWTRLISGRVIIEKIFALDRESGWRKCSSFAPPTSTIIRELKQTRRRRKRERHLKMELRVSAIIFQLFKVIMLEKCVLTILELIWNQRLGHKTKLNICHHILTSSTQLQNTSFHVLERTRTSSKCQKMKNARAKRAKMLFFIVKYAILWGFCCRRRLGCLSSLL